MGEIKLTTWNIKWLGKSLVAELDPGSDDTSVSYVDALQDRKARLRQQFQQLDSDVICIQEGPEGEHLIQHFCASWLEGDYVPVLAPPGGPSSLSGKYGMKGEQWIWFLIRASLVADLQPELQPLKDWWPERRRTWDVIYLATMDGESHGFHRHPQVLRLQLPVGGAVPQQLDIIGVHLKSKYVPGEIKPRLAEHYINPYYIKAAAMARVKLATEAVNIRDYLNQRFSEASESGFDEPAIIICGDMNDGPGKEFLERHFLFFDLLSNIQGDVFFARRFLYHVLFELDQQHRWTAVFDDDIMDQEDVPRLLDHILLTQNLVDGGLPVRMRSGSGMVEHEVHDAVNVGLSEANYKRTSDHRPVSVRLEW